MTITHPRSDIFESFVILTTRFGLDEFQDVSRLRGGTIISRDLGVGVWSGDFRSAVMSHDDCIELEAALRSLRGAVHPFYVHDTRRPVPRKAPAVFADTAVVQSFDMGTNRLSIKNAARMQLMPGDRISLTYPRGANMLSTILELAEPVTVSESKTTPLFQVNRRIPAEIAVGQAVRMRPARLLAQLEPDAISFNDSGGLLGTVSFKATEFM